MVVALVSYLLGDRLLGRLVAAAAGRSRNKWDDALLNNGVVRALVLAIPAVVLYQLLDFFGGFRPVAEKILNIGLLGLFILIVDRGLSAFLDIYDSSDLSTRRPLKGYVQLVKMFIYIVGTVMGLSLILDKSPWGLLSGIGALTAVILLIFKDTVLSFVASMQIASYDLFRKGDWIEMPNFGADGDVVDISLHTVRVQNWDKTLVSIPTHQFLENSFKNWRGMTMAGGRRIKRSVLVDQASIRICSDEELEALSSVDFLAEYIRFKRREIQEHNVRFANLEGSSPVNGRALTNIGLFRTYVAAYLRHNPRLRQDLTLMVRQLQPTAEGGLPLEIYCFTNVTAWTEYEGIQSDIFDHVLAAMPYFGLKVFQREASRDKRADCLALVGRNCGEGPVRK
ncbi:MAG: mechanosensitive ion channel [Deltaproteobacteria bacterium]|nr:mechanosensitive ion channel [Deltaproteobacteria bacterium]